MLETFPTEGGQAAKNVDNTLTSPVTPPVFKTPPAISVSPAADRVTLAPQATAVAATRKLLAAPQFDGKVIGTASIDPKAVSQYEALADGLQTIQLSSGLRTVMISSTTAHEGKTLTVVNLALTLSERLGKRVLLVDADFESPAIHELFGAPNISGLADALSSPAANVPVLAVSKTLTVLTAGRVRPDSMSALLTPRMKALLVEAAADFDWVLLDAAPISRMADPGLMAWLAEGVVLVVEANKTPTRAVQAAIRELGAERVLGAVLNRAATPA
jgi:capsular exopolysaccharide synthesis family protein